MGKSIVFAVYLLSGLMSLSAIGAEVEGLYDAEVRVFSQQGKARATAMSAALAEVLVKVSGRSSVLSVDGIKRAVREPAGLLQQYRYRELTYAEQQALRAEQQQNPDMGAAGGLQGEPQMLLFSFDEIAVDKLLGDNRLPVWGATRPSMIAWLAVQNEEGRILLGSHSEDPLSAEVIEAARQHGLPLFLPLMDLEDQRALRFADVWGGFAEPVLQASSRYRTEAVLMGRLYPGFGGAWQAQWTVLEGSIRKTWETQEESREKLIRGGVAGATELLASRYAPAAGGPERAGLLPLMITGINNLSDYSRVSRYLASLQQVAQVRITQVEPDRIQFDLIIEGPAEGITKTIALGNVLVPAVAPANVSRFSISAEGPPTALPSPLGAPAQVYQLQP